MKIKEYLQKTQDEKFTGFFIHGDENNGEYRDWYLSNQLWVHYFYKNKRLHGDYKYYNYDGKLIAHKIYKKWKNNKRFFKRKVK